jgi:hypothetical protein
MSRTAWRAKLGPILFGATLLAVLVFFWWFLIYRHGFPAAH